MNVNDLWGWITFLCFSLFVAVIVATCLFEGRQQEFDCFKATKSEQCFSFKRAK